MLPRDGEEADLLERALNAFYRATGLRAAANREQLTGPYRARLDALVHLTIGGKGIRLAAEVKRRLTNTTLGVAVQNLTRYHQKGLLIADYVNPNMAERLKDMNVRFMDTVGNAYLNEPGLFVFIKGQRPVQEHDLRRATRAFQPTGLKVLFALLCRPELVNAPYRNIAEAAGVALGTVGWVITDLRQQGHLLDMGKRGRKLVQKGRLFERWVTAYPDQLRPKLLIDRFTAPEPDWWRHAQIRDLQAYWGGEVAAARLTRYLKPEVITIYVRDLPGKLQVVHKLKNDPRGNTELLKAFWNDECDWMDRDIVHPVLVYADLLATGDPRNIETAKILYDNEIVGLIRED